MEVNGFIDPPSELIADLHVLWREAAPHALVLQVSVQSIGERIVLRRVDVLCDYDWLRADRRETQGRTAVEYLINPKLLETSR